MIAQPEVQKTYISITKEDLQALCDRAADTAARVAIEKFLEKNQKDKEHRHDRRLHNTDMLLRNYHMFKLSIEDAVYTVKQLEEENAGGILSLMDDRDDTDITIESIKKSKIKTAAIVAHIDKMLDVYKIYCEQSSDELDQRRYEVLYDRYIADPPCTVTEIAEKQVMSKESVYIDLKIAKERMAALIFGIDGMNIQL